MKLAEVKRVPPMISSLVRKLLAKGVEVKARVEISSISGTERGDAKILSVADDGWSFQLRDLIDDDGSFAPLSTDFKSTDDEELTLEKTKYGYLMRYKQPKKYIGV